MSTVVIKKPQFISIMLGFVYSPFIEVILYGDNYSLKIKVPHFPANRGSFVWKWTNMYQNFPAY